MYRCTHTHAQDCVHHCTYTRTLTQTRQGEMTHETLGVQTFTDVRNGLRCRLEFGNPSGRKGLPSDYFEGAIERCVCDCARVCVYAFQKSRCVQMGRGGVATACAHMHYLYSRHNYSMYALSLQVLPQHPYLFDLCPLHSGTPLARQRQRAKSSSDARAAGLAFSILPAGATGTSAAPKKWSA